MNTLFKDLRAGSPVYALIKKDNELQYCEGLIVSVGQPRLDMPKANNGQIDMSQFSSMRNVVDVTYSLEGKNYTDAVDVTDCMFPTEKTGAITLVATDKEPIIRELHATRKKAEDYIKAVDTEVPRNKKRIEECDTLISLLDTKYAEKQEFEKRIKKLEDGSTKTNELLEKILNKLK